MTIDVSMWARCSPSVKEWKMFKKFIHLDRGSMLWSQFSTIFANFLRKWRFLIKNQRYDQINAQFSFVLSQKLQFFRHIFLRKKLKILTSVPDCFEMDFCEVAVRILHKFPQTLSALACTDSQTRWPDEFMKNRPTKYSSKLHNA
jgi:hypothetical protein